MTQAPATPSFGDVVENGWASEENPTRKGYFVRAFKRIGRMNPGLTWEVTDRAGRFWEVQPRVIGDRLTVTPQAAALEAQQARIAELEFVLAVMAACSRDSRTNVEMAEITKGRAEYDRAVSQALADRHERALREIAAGSLFVLDNRKAVCWQGGDPYAIAERALSSSRGRHEGVTSGSIPELPGVNAVQQPASSSAQHSDGTPMPADFVEEVRARLTMIADDAHLRGRTTHFLGEIRSMDHVVRVAARCFGRPTLQEQGGMK